MEHVRAKKEPVFTASAAV